VGARVQVTRGGSVAAPGREAGAGVARARAAPELLWAGRREPEPRGHVTAPELP
jgi:hypothetical protein